MITLSRERALELGSFLRRLGEEKIEIFITRDPQYQALEKLYRELGECYSLGLLVLLNSIVSYQLTSKGEEYWWEFASYKDFKRSVGDPDKLWDAFRVFLLSCKGNASLREAKLRRITRIREEEFHIEVYAKLEDFIKDLSSLVKRLSEILRQNIDDKTIVFAAKMLFYVSKICGIRAGGFEGIKIPIDRRVAAVSYTSELVDVVGVKDVIDAIMREKKTALRAWGIVSETSSVPMIKLDSLIWFMGKYVRDKDPVERVVRDLSTSLREYISVESARELAKQFLRRRIE